MAALFLPVAVGYVAARLKLMDDGFDNQLSKLVLNVTLPCILVASASTSDGLPDAVTSMGCSASRRWSSSAIRTPTSCL